jgi:putative transferase (TIGR04331 family)
LHIPVAYLESYPELVKQVAHNGWPSRPCVIWTSNAENSNEHFKAYTAEKVEQGSPFVMGQHGGHFGVGLWSFNEEHHLAIADSYFSWGWKEVNTPHIRPLGQFKYKKPIGVNHCRQNRVLLVTSNMPRYSYHMYSVVVSRQWLDYLEDQFTFCRSLPLHLRRALIVRLFPNDYGWDQALRWHDHWPDVELDSGRCKMEDLIRQCRIYVSTYNATTYLESFTMNVPTVIFWNPEHWELRASAQPYFDELEKAGIFHKTPEGAARHVAMVWNDVQAWWERSDVQKVRQKFCERYARMPDDLLRRVENALQDVAQTARTRNEATATFK